MIRLHPGYLLLCCCLLLSACGSDSGDSPAAANPEPVARGDNPIVSAHRGGAAYAPENTLLAMDNAIRLGVDQLEADTQLSADGVAVLIHDDTLDRTTDCNGPVNAKTLEELQSCDAAHWFSPGQAVTSPDDAREHPLRGEGITIPTAEALLAQLAAMGDEAPGLSIEIKDIPPESNFDPVGTQVASVLVPLIQQYGLQDKTIIQSFWPTVLDAVKLMDSSIRTQFLTSSELGIIATLNLLYSTARLHDILAPDFESPDFNATLVDLAHTLGKQVIPWTMDSRSELEAVTALGVDGLITNYPACLLAIQGRRGQGEAAPMGVPAIADCPGE